VENGVNGFVQTNNLSGVRNSF